MRQNKKMIAIIICLILVFGCVVTLTLHQPSQKQSPAKKQTEQQLDEYQTDQQESSQETTQQKDKEDTNHKTTSTQKEETESSSKKTESKQSKQKQEQSQPSTKQEQASQSQQEQNTTQEVHYITISIDCQTLLNHMDQVPEQYQPYIPSNGIILNSKKVKMNDGDSVFDMIIKTTKMNKIQLSQNAGYIQSIHNLPEKMLQGSGGWMYSVNGKYASIGCKEYKLKNGDHIAWRYTSYTGDLNS